MSYRLYYTIIDIFYKQTIVNIDTRCEYSLCSKNTFMYPNNYYNLMIKFKKKYYCCSNCLRLNKARNYRQNIFKYEEL